MTAPNLTNYQTFITNVMGIGASYLPSSSPFIQHTFDQALNIADTDIGQVPAQTTSWSPYELAVYNLGGHLLIEFAADQSYAVSAATWSNGLTTLTTAAPHQIAVGDEIAVSGLSPLPYVLPQPGKGQFVAYLVPDNTHVGYLVKDPGTPTPVLASAAVAERFFARARAGFKINSLVPGVVTNASDVSTGAGLLNPEFMRSLTLENLQLLKTPYGRSYLQIAQKYGPTIWGLT